MRSMIFIESLIEYLYDYKNLLLEESLPNLMKISDPKRVYKSKNLITIFNGISQDVDGQIITNWLVSSETNPNKKYKVEVCLVVKGGLIKEAKRKWDVRRFINLLSTADVRVYCPCPDFYWSGSKYNLGPFGSLFKKDHTLHRSAEHDKDSDIVFYPPNIRDPQRKNVLCKHLSAVARRLSANSMDIMSQIRKYATRPDLIPIDLDANTRQVNIKNFDIENNQIINNLISGIEDK